MSYKTTKKILKKSGMYTGEVKKISYDLKGLATEKAFDDLERFMTALTPKERFKKQISRFEAVCNSIQKSNIPQIKHDKRELVETARELEQSIKTLMIAKNDFEQPNGSKKVELEFLLTMAFECMSTYSLCLNRLGFERAVDEGNNQIKGRKEKARNTQKLHQSIKRRADEISKAKPHLSKKSIAYYVSKDKSFWDDLCKDGFAQANKPLSPETIRKII